MASSDYTAQLPLVSTNPPDVWGRSILEAITELRAKGATQADIQAAIQQALSSSISIDQARSDALQAVVDSRNAQVATFGIRDETRTYRDQAAASVGTITAPAEAQVATYIEAGPARNAVELRYAQANRKPFLTNMREKIRAGGKWRALLAGTSIASFDNASPRVLMEHLKDMFGDARLFVFPLGGYGGSYDSIPATGWRRQRYGGIQGTRLRAEPGGVTLNANGIQVYGDRVTIGCSVESDSTPATVRVVGPDGTIYSAQTPAASSQKYRSLVEFQLPSVASYLVYLDAPATGATGYAYYETVEVGTSTASGVEFVDASMGGMGIRHMTTPMDSNANMAPSIAISGTSGLDYHFKRSDVDAIILQHLTNDGDVTVFKSNVDYAVEQTRVQGIPLLVIVEPGQDPNTRKLQREHLQSLRKWGHVTVIDWHNAVFTTPATLMHSLYYTGSDTTHIDQRGYVVLNSILTTELGIIPIPLDTVSAINRRRVRGSKFVPEPAGRVASIDAPGVNPAAGIALPAPSGLAVMPHTQPFLDSNTITHERYYQAPLRNNRFRNTQKTIRTTPDGTDEYGKYINGSAFFMDGPSADLEVWMLTLKIGPRTPGQNVSIGLARNAWQMVDSAGRVVPQQDANVNQIIYQPDAGSTAPIVIAIPFRRLSASSPSNGNLSITGKVYDITLTQSSVPVFDTNVLTVSGMDYIFKPLDVEPETVAIVTSGGARSVRYQVEDFTAWEYRGLKTGFDIYTFAGEAVSGYRDARAVNLAPSVNADIAASTTSRQWGKYISVGNRDLGASTWGMAVGDVRRVTFRGSGGALALKITGDFRVSVNGRDANPEVTGDQFTRMFPLSAAADPPGIFSVEILKRSNTGGSVTLNGDIYELSVTDSSAPIMTDADGVI